jgi:hypothetical protein
LDAETGRSLLLHDPHGRDKLVGILPKDWEVGCYSCGCLDMELLLSGRSFVLCFLALESRWFFLWFIHTRFRCRQTYTVLNDQTYCAYCNQMSILTLILQILKSESSTPTPPRSFSYNCPPSRTKCDEAHSGPW